MIILRKLSGKEVVLNAELIEAIESTPDTVITLVTGNRYIVKDSPQEVIERVVEFKSRIMRDKGTIAPDWQNLKKV